MTPNNQEYRADFKTGVLTAAS